MSTPSPSAATRLRVGAAKHSRLPEDAIVTSQSHGLRVIRPATVRRSHQLKPIGFTLSQRESYASSGVRLPPPHDIVTQTSPLREQLHHSNLFRIRCREFASRQCPRVWRAPRQCDGAPAITRFQRIIIGVRPMAVWQLGAFSHSRNVGESIGNDAMHCVDDDANRQGGLLRIEVVE